MKCRATWAGGSAEGGAEVEEAMASPTALWIQRCKDAGEGGALTAEMFAVDLFKMIRWSSPTICPHF